MKWHITQNEIQFKETLEKPLICLSQFLLGEGTNQNVKICGPSPWPTLTVCHIHVPKVFPWGNRVTKRVVFLGLPDYNSVDRFRQRLKFLLIRDYLNFFL